MSEVYRKLQTCLESVRARTSFQPEIALILGSGLGDYADEIDIEETLEYTAIEGFPTSTVAGHKGRFVFGRVHGVPVVIMQGRVHFYEGYPMQDVVLPTRLMGLMGAKKLVLTNAAGGINPGFQPGCFMLLTDHINYSGMNPLIGPNLDEFGPRFPDMSDIYTRALREKLLPLAREAGIPLREGVYVMYSGPNYETPAEIRFFRAVGGDAAGMSTVPEALAARHAGLQVMGVSCITNMAAGVLPQPLSHEEVVETAGRVKRDFTRLLELMIDVG